MQTFLGWQVFQVNQHGKVVACLGRYDVRSILPLEHLLGAVLHQLLEAADLNGEEDLCLRLWSGDVVKDAIEIGNGLVDVDGRSPDLLVSNQPSSPKRAGE